MGGFLNKDGLSYLWRRIKDNFVAKETGKGLSSNDFTDEEKQKLAGLDAGGILATNTVFHSDGSIVETSTDGMTVTTTFPTANTIQEVYRKDGKTTTKLITIHADGNVTEEFI